MEDNQYADILIPRYANGSSGDWYYVLKNRNGDPEGSKSRLFLDENINFERLKNLMIDKNKEMVTSEEKKSWKTLKATWANARSNKAS